MNVQQRSVHKHQSCSAQAIGQQMHVLQLIVSMRSVDHGSWLSHIDTGMRAFSSEQGPGLSSKCSAEVLDRQLVSAVLRSSVG